MSQEYPVVHHDGLRWMRVTGAPCPLCAVWIGPHDHSIGDDGRIGPLVVAADLDAPDPVAMIRDALRGEGKP